jgi:hypothetical protein
MMVFFELDVTLEFGLSLEYRVEFSRSFIIFEEGYKGETELVDLIEA